MDISAQRIEELLTGWDDAQMATEDVAQFISAMFQKYAALADLVLHAERFSPGDPVDPDWQGIVRVASILRGGKGD